MNGKLADNRAVRRETAPETNEAPNLVEEIVAGGAAPRSSELARAEVAAGADVRRQAVIEEVIGLAKEAFQTHSGFLRGGNALAESLAEVVEEIVAHDPEHHWRITRATSATGQETVALVVKPFPETELESMCISADLYTHSGKGFSVMINDGFQTELQALFQIALENCRDTGESWDDPGDID